MNLVKHIYFQEKFKNREKEIIEQTRRECAEEAAREAARVAKLHAEEMLRQQHK